MSRTRILAIGAHCGDMEVTAGAVLANCVRHGGQVALVHMSLGEKGHPDLDPRTYGAQKEKEAGAAGEVLGADTVTIMPFRDAEVRVSDEAVLGVEITIRQWRPNSIITHSASSIHPDHVATHQIALAAAFAAGMKWLPRDSAACGVYAVYFAENWEDREGFSPYAYVDVSADWETWRKCISMYALFRGEVVKFPYRDYYEALSTVRGAEVGVARAVAFDIPSERKRTLLQQL